MPLKRKNHGKQSGSISLRATLLLCAALVLAGAVALTVIYNTEPEVQRESAVRENAMLVDVITAEAGTFRPIIEAMGTVTPAREVTLRPRISGEVLSMAAEFVPGGEVAAGDEMLRLDSADYRIALEQRQGELQQALAALEIEHGRQQIAIRDYRQLNKDLEPENRALVLREPQLKSAEAVVRAARAAVERAQLDLDRTTVKAPFHAQVLSREVNLGSQVSSGDALARLVGVDTYWVETTLPLDRLRWLTFAEEDSDGSPVSVRHRTAWPDGTAREGYLYRLVGELEGDTRMARVIVAVDDPLGREGGEEAPALLIGSFVECRIHGRPIENVVRIPRSLVRKDDTVWLKRDGKLVIQPVDIVFQDAAHAFVGKGLSAGDQVVTTSLATVKEGISLRLKS